MINFRLAFHKISFSETRYSGRQNVAQSDEENTKSTHQRKPNQSKAQRQRGKTKTAIQKKETQVRTLLKGNKQKQTSTRHLKLNQQIVNNSYIITASIISIRKEALRSSGRS